MAKLSTGWKWSAMSSIGGEIPRFVLAAPQSSWKLPGVKNGFFGILALALIFQPIALRAVDPASVPDLVSYWDFHEPAGQDRVAKGPGAYRLQEMGGPIKQSVSGPFGKFAVRLKKGQWFRIPRGEFPLLDFHGPDARLTVIAWLKREATSPWQAVAGVWNESAGQRQYCLFLNAASRTDWRTMTRAPSKDLVHGHVSDVGGNTAGHKACITYSSSPQTVTVGAWQMVAMTYDGAHSRVYVDGRLVADEGRNPFPLPQGLFHGNADFTVGAVDRHGEIGNFLDGTLSGLAVYSRALSEEELISLAKPQ